MSTLKKVLIVDDEDDHLFLIKRSFDDSEKFTLEFQTSLKKALDIIPVFKPDIILSDFKLPDGDAREIITQYSYDIPIVIMTSYGNESLAVELIKAGAMDYFIKSPDTFLNINWIIQRVWREWRHMTEHRKIEEDKKLLAELLEMAPASFVVHDEQGNFLYANQKALGLGDYHENNLSGLSPKNSFLNEVLPKDIFQMNGMDEINFEIDHKHKDGSMVPLNVYSRSINWNNRKFVLTVTTDITDIKNYQKEILDKNKEIEIQNLEYRKLMDELVKSKEKAEESDRLKSAFLANMSHEIRTPMNGIIGFADLLEDNSIEDDKKKQFLQIIKTSGLQLLNIINDIIDISKIETHQIRFTEEKVNISQIMNDLVSFFYQITEKKNLQLTISSMVGNDQDECKTDGVKLRQILTNLINNAIKFTDCGFIKVLVSVKDHLFYFEVQDSGCGISKENQSVIFDRFRQVDDKKGSTLQVGTGLGLAISKAYIELNGGKISVSSEPGKGSAFSFTWPYVSAKELPLKNGDEFCDVNKSSTSIYNWSGKNILVAEDELVNFFYVRELLTPTGANIIKAVNGKEVLDYLSKNPYPDIILMDLKMPLLNGYDATIEIRRTNKDVPIIAVTAYAFAGEKEKAMNAGCHLFIHKPFRKEELLSAISQFIG